VIKVGQGRQGGNSARVEKANKWQPVSGLRMKRISFYCPSSMGYRPHFKKWGIAHLHWRAAQVSAERIASQ